MVKAQVYGRDNLAASVMALLVDPKFVYPNDETGKAALIAAITAKLDDMRRRLPRFFPELPGAQVQIRRVAAFLESGARSEEHTSELQSLMRISYAVFCLKKKKKSQLT